jgi:shikimate dehydrogenase
MKLALIGFPISHSKSPQLYKRFLGDVLESYDLLEIPRPESMPTLTELSKRFDGISITTPYKEFYFHQVKIIPEEVKNIGAINTILFHKGEFLGTNTDFIATKKQIEEFINTFPQIHFIILGNGVMAKMTKLILDQFKLSCHQFYRSKDGDISKLDLTQYFDRNTQIIVINACSRDFKFNGKIHDEFIFWDFNYAFEPHRLFLPQKVKQYIDGEKMLEQQALSAIEFWKNNS